MDTNWLHQGTLCCTQAGTGWIMKVDREHHTLRLRNQLDGHEFEVDFDEVIDERPTQDPDLGL
ncbi:hypothetical protein PVT67_01950 [Gallaecimonas kandeliae]|uniref:hypothetical protein n=1 Tax=Gallaecimonas kandeliae TaxID=3029055 RepID=UPI0026477E2A|nr:hypothetical protein [Gallaecimonas kandeliae]WKE66036.1 hypothetical protein PVT67_01950 [Gallaecimonas kandeliae]